MSELKISDARVSPLRDGHLTGLLGAKRLFLTKQPKRTRPTTKVVLSNSVAHDGDATRGFTVRALPQYPWIACFAVRVWDLLLNQA